MSPGVPRSTGKEVLRKGIAPPFCARPCRSTRKGRRAHGGHGLRGGKRSSRKNPKCRIFVRRRRGANAGVSRRALRLATLPSSRASAPPSLGGRETAGPRSWHLTVFRGTRSGRTVSFLARLCSPCERRAREPKEVTNGGGKESVDGRPERRSRSEKRCCQRSAAAGTPVPPSRLPSEQLSG